jgi:hypothetical protein
MCAERSEKSSPSTDQKQPATDNRQQQTTTAVEPKRDGLMTGDDYAKIDQILGLAEKPKPATQEETDKPKGVEPKPKREAGEVDQDRKKSDELFKPESLFDDDDADIAGEEKPKRQRRKTFAEFAEAQGFEPDALLELQIPDEDGDGTPMSVGDALKRIKEVKNFEIRRDEFEDFHHTAMMEVQQGREQLDGIISKLSEVVPADQLAEALQTSFEDRARHIAQERKLSLELMPDWADKAQRDADLDEMDKFVQGFGFKPGQLRTILDAKMMYFVNWSWRMASRYNRMRERLNQQGNIPVNVPTKRGAKVDSRQQVDQLVKAGKRDEAVNRILGME